MKFPALAQVEAYWEALRAGRLVPRRSDVDPRGIEGALEHSFVLERIAPGIARIRVAGARMTEMMGMEVRGMPISALFAPEARDQLAEGLESMFQSPAMVELTLSGETGMGRPALDGRMLLLPLSSDLGDVTHALGCLATQGSIGRTPRRFTILAARQRRLIDNGQPLRAQDTFAPRPDQPARGFGEPRPAFQPAPQSAQPTVKPLRTATTPARPSDAGPTHAPGRRGHLRLVKSDSDDAS